MASSLAADNGVDNRPKLIANALGKNADFVTAELPGFKSLLHDHLSPDVDTDKYSLIRRLLKVFKESNDSTCQDLLGWNNDYEKERVERSVEEATAADYGKSFQTLPNLGTR